MCDLFSKILTSKTKSMDPISIVYKDIEYTLYNVFINGKITPCAVAVLDKNESSVKIKQVASTTVKELSNAVKKEAKQIRTSYLMLNDKTTEEALSLLSKENKLKEVADSLSYCKTVIVV